MREDFIRNESPEEIGAPNFGDIIKEKIEYVDEKKEEDNQTEIDYADEEEKDSEDSHEFPKKQRKDVSYKTILRKCRKYYQQLFNAHTGFLRNKKKEPCSFYRDCILKFIEE